MSGQVRWFDAADREARISLRWSQHGSDVIPLDVGEMGCYVPERLQAALITGIGHSDLGYAPLARKSDLVRAVSSFAQDKYGWKLNESLVYPIASILTALDECLCLFAESHSPVVAVGPLYPGIRQVIVDRCHPLEVVDLDCGPAGYYLDIDRVESQFRSGAGTLITASPHSPTGHVFSADEITALVRLLEKYRVTAYVDEVYAPLIYPDSAFLPIGKAAAGRAKVFSVGSVSKAWNLASLKASWIICPSIEARNKLGFLSTRTLGSLGALAVRSAAVALTDCRGWIDEVARQLAHHADQTARGLAQLSSARGSGPQSGLFAWIRIDGVPSPAKFFYRNARVALADGQSYGPNWSQWVRLNLATHPDILGTGIERMTASFDDAS